MTTLPQDVEADLRRRILELEQRLDKTVAERDEAVERQTAAALVNFRLHNELRASGDRHNASAEILRTIANTSGDAEHALQRIADTAARFFNASSVTIRITDGTQWIRTIAVGNSSERIAAAVPISQLPIGGKNLPGTVYRENRQIQIPDLDNVDPAFADFPGIPPARAGGTRTMSGTPLRRGDGAIGALIIHRDRLAPFTAEELALQQNFADQAVIAIENARLFNETKEALERQTATSDILKVIASSPSDVQPVFEAIAERSNRLLGGLSTAVFSLVDNMQHLMAFTPTNPEADAALKSVFPRPLSEVFWGEAILKGEIFRIADAEAELETLPAMREIARLRGWRSALIVPLSHNQKSIGLISVTRGEPGPFADHDVQLLRTFADQAVIAIENARLFNETREALERQTATADILKVIASSPSDVQPVFEAIATSANRLIGAFSTAVHRVIDDVVHLAAFTPTNPESDAALKAAFPRHRSEVPAAGLVENGEPAQIADAESADPHTRRLGRARGWRSVTFTPLMSQGEFIGFIACTRLETGVLADHHVQLLRTFADQAVIAIENARLFNETREALERQTATADILKVIASSPSDVQPVFEAIATSAKRLIGGFSSTVFRFIDGIAYLKAFTPTTAKADEILQSTFPRPVADYQPFQTTQAGDVTQVPDTEAPSYELKDIARARGYRSMVFAPLMNKGESIGMIAVTRVQPGNFTDHHVQLLQTFADQAVIAIENARLFDEVQARTRDLEEALRYQTGSAGILNVIASSPTDVKPVLEAIAESACELCGAYDALVRLKDGDSLVFGAHHGPLPVNLASVPVTETSTAGAAVIARKPIHVHDLLSTDGDRFPGAQELARVHGERTILSVPLLREGEGIGAIILRRAEVHPFSDRQIALLQTFADQAVIAIQNVKLFDEVQARTRELTESLQQQTATADVLKVISRSTFDLKTVLQTLVESAARLCDADTSQITRQKDGVFFRAETYGFSEEFIKYTTTIPVAPDRGSAIGRALLEGKAAHVPDVLADPEYTFIEARQFADYRAVLAVPLLREGAPIGVIVMTRKEPRPFTEKHIELATTFADQAAIAIGNVQLFDAVQTRTKELARSLEDLRAAQDRLIQTEKLASLGQLTAGIAHEIKNPLNFVNNFSALSVELTDELSAVLKQTMLADRIRAEVDELTGTLKDNLGKVVQHGKRADSIVKNMLLHSREGSGEHRQADVNALVDESLNLAYHGARAEKPHFNVTLERDFDPAAGSADVFPQEITRVLLNLISNGFYAVTKRKVENAADFEPTVRATTLSRGDHVEIRIRDNGTGIPEHVREKMFNPFFTTKPAGEGTGLGLSMSHDIVVKQHGGSIEVATEPGAFTEFRIVLPRASIISGKAGGTG